MTIPANIHPKTRGKFSSPGRKIFQPEKKNSQPGKKNSQGWKISQRASPYKKLTFR
jgi:hypothetical protein